MSAVRVKEAGKVLNHNDGVGGSLYRAYHDAIASESYDRAVAVAIVLSDYNELLSFVT